MDFFYHQTMEQAETLFFVHILDGYSFRNTIGMIKSEIDYATMVLSPHTIEISFINTNKRAGYKIVLNVHDLAMYRYNIRDEDGNYLPEYPIAFETEEFFNTTKGIGRRDAVRLYWLEGDNKFNVQPMKTSTKDPGRAGALFVKILNMEYIRYDIPKGYPSEPNIRVQAKDFADICAQGNTLKCSRLEIVGEPNRITFKSILPNNTLASVNRFVSHVDIPRKTPTTTISNIDEVDQLIGNLRISEAPMMTNHSLSLNIMKNEDLMTVSVPISTVKALSKIHNISPSGTLLRFYFGENKPVKIETNIGTYGTCTICLRNTN